jgi:hypothetical protein
MRRRARERESAVDGGCGDGHKVGSQGVGGGRRCGGGHETVSRRPQDGEPPPSGSCVAAFAGDARGRT